MMISSRPPQPRYQKAPGPGVGEKALAGAAIGSNWGTVGGAALGGVATVAGIGYAGMRLGANFGPLGAAAGAAVGVAAGLVEERQLHLGATAGGFVGLVAGGAIGGAIGAVTGLIR